MKHLPFLLLAMIAAGCQPRSEFDISAAQAKKRFRGGPGGPGGPDMLKNLPPGAVKHEKVYHKGDRLPDGTISDGERKMVTVELKR